MTDRGCLTSDEQTRIGRESLPPLKLIAAELLALADDIFRNRVPYDPTNGADVMSLSFVTKQREHLRSVELLIDSNAHRDAGLIARTMLEGQIMLDWAFEGVPDRTDLWFWFGAILDWRQILKNEDAGRSVNSGDKQQLREFVEMYGPNYISGKVRKKLREAENNGTEYQMPDDPWRDKWTEMSVASMAEAVGSKELYDSLYRPTSGWVHWDPRGINLAFQRTEWGMAGFTDFDWAGASRALVAGCSALLSSLELLNNHFSLGWSSRLQEIRMNMTQSLNRLLAEERVPADIPPARSTWTSEKTHVEGPDRMPRSRQMQIIRDWLLSNDAKFYERSSRERFAALHWDERSQEEEQLESISPDFRVVSPIPMSIEVVHRPRFGRRDPGAGRDKDQLLALRILSGMRTGPSLPMLAAIAPTHEIPPDFQVPYMDGTLRLDQLPPLDQIRRYAKPDLTVRRILLEGEPRRVTVSDPIDIETRWASALSMQQLENDQVYPDGSIAQVISSRYREIRNRGLQREAVSSAPQRFENPSRFWGPTLPFVERTVESAIQANLGGEFRRFPVEWPGAEGNLLSKAERFWVTPTGRRVLVRISTMNNRGPNYPVLSLARQLVTPWVYRSFGHAHGTAFLMILGSYQQPAPPVAAINDLESAGWTVMPWDFSEPEPAFMTFLRSVAEV